MDFLCAEGDAQSRTYDVRVAVQLLANSKLVAVCQLQHCKLTLVPYLEGRSGKLCLMGFLIADDLGT